MTQQHNQTSSTYSAASVFWPAQQRDTDLILPITNVLPYVRKYLGAIYIQVNDTAISLLTPHPVNCNLAFDIVQLVNLYDKAISEKTECKRIKGTFEALYPFSSALIADIYQEDDGTLHIKVCNKCGFSLVRSLLDHSSAQYTGIAAPKVDLSIGSESIQQTDKLEVGTKPEHLGEEIKHSAAAVLGGDAVLPKDVSGPIEVAKQEDKEKAGAVDTLGRSDIKLALLDSIIHPVKSIEAVSALQPNNLEISKILNILEAGGYKFPQQLTSLPQSSDHFHDVPAIKSEEYLNVIKQQPMELPAHTHSTLDTTSDNTAREVCVGQDCQKEE